MVGGAWLAVHGWLVGYGPGYGLVIAGSSAPPRVPGSQRTLPHSGPLTRVPRVDAGIGLDHILYDPPLCAQLTAQARDDAGRQRVIQAKGVTWVP